MRKQEAIEIFSEPTDRRPAADALGRLCDALGLTRHSIYHWPDDLPLAISDRVLGAAVRHGRDVSDFLEAEAREAA